MNLMGISTISSYIQGLKLDMKRQERMNNLGKQKKDEEIDPKVAEMKRWVESERRGQEIASIKSKMMSGSYLTAEERDYLKTNCPELYEEAEKIQREREAYKKALENCKSKEDVDKLHQQKMDSFYSEAKQIMGNPHIPKLKKAIMLEYVTMRMNAVGEDHAEFIQSDRYQALPDEKYENKEREDDSINNTDRIDDISDDTKPTDNSTESDVPADGSIVEADTENKVVDPVKAIHEMRGSFSVRSSTKKHSNSDSVNRKGTEIDSGGTKKHAVINAYNTYARADTSRDSVDTVKSRKKTSISI